jgi:hypothetical protein
LSGTDFEEEKLNVKGEKFKDASIFYNDVSEIETKELKRWLKNLNKFNGIIKIL